MATENEIPTIQKAIYLRLTESPDADTLTSVISCVRARRGEQKPSYPFVLFNLQSGDDALSQNKVRMLVEPVYLIRVVAKLEAGTSTIPEDVKIAANEIDNLMQNMRRKSFTDIPGYFFNSWRENFFEKSYPDPNNAAGEYYHLGGFYHVQAFK